MALNVERKELDDFCPQLFHTLDGLGLLPRSLRAKPNEFEKYPRLLFGSIQRYNDVEAGCSEWESRVLRDAPYRIEQNYPELEALRHWMVQHQMLFATKANMQHLRTSLYSRIFQYLYPRRIVVNTYCEKHRGNPKAIEREFLAQAFPASIETEVAKLKDVYGNEWESIIADSRASLLANAVYYRKVLRGEEALDNAVEQETTEEPMEEPQ